MCSRLVSVPDLTFDARLQSETVRTPEAAATDIFTVRPERVQRKKVVWNSAVGSHQ